MLRLIKSTSGQSVSGPGIRIECKCAGFIGIIVFVCEREIVAALRPRSYTRGASVRRDDVIETTHMRDPTFILITI